MLNKIEINETNFTQRVGILAVTYAHQIWKNYAHLIGEANRLAKNGGFLEKCPPVGSQTYQAYEKAAAELEHFFIANDIVNSVATKNPKYATRAIRNAIVGKFSPLHAEEDDKKEWHEDVVESYEEKHGV